MPWDAYDDMQANRRWLRRGRADDSSGDSEDELPEPPEPLTPIRLSRPHHEPAPADPPTVDWPPADVHLGTVRSGEDLVCFIETPGPVVVHRTGPAVRALCQGDRLSILIPADQLTPGTAIEEALEVSSANGVCVIRLFGAVASRQESPVLDQPARNTPPEHSPPMTVEDNLQAGKRSWKFYLFVLLMMTCIGLLLLVALMRS